MEERINDACLWWKVVSVLREETPNRVPMFFLGGRILLNPSGNVPIGISWKSWNMSLWFFVQMHNHTRNIANNIKPQFFFHIILLCSMSVWQILALLENLVTCFIRLPLMQAPQMLRVLGSMMFSYVVALKYCDVYISWIRVQSRIVLGIVYLLLFRYVFYLVNTSSPEDALVGSTQMHANSVLVARNKSQKLQFMLQKIDSSHHTHSLITNDFILHTSVVLYRSLIMFDTSERWWRLDWTSWIWNPEGKDFGSFRDWISFWGSAYFQLLRWGGCVFWSLLQWEKMQKQNKK